MKERLDVLLVDRKLYPSRQQAQRAIMAGLVRINGERKDKPGTKVPKDAQVEVAGREHPYVSRGGLKLEKALQQFGIHLEGRVVLDIGASTGGFTDCALQNGAAKVYAVDVGYGQLAWKLRQDHRVTVMERTNFRYMRPEDLSGERPDFSTVDVSFISLSLILPPLKLILKDSGEVITLIKPQFEAGREQVGRKGIVRDPQIHRDVLTNFYHMAQREGYSLKGLIPSPITGSHGNIEFLGWLEWKAESSCSAEPTSLIHEAVELAHEKGKTT
ncbi:TlyA family RNA methyltransferase [Melghirimyces algeriensis]|uniref:23S rRNA (Cytidine1920-2'-O)/16S rRNA (Cytidine1409-2'-O)-methyltransferase n=1 Tax=Melghirimyces algeriensis TaxID=910412 RepID=A0A521AZG6_9BACL|nr:TlyA family RNA methyltransferase [Melghirimyces algeriensis]SMO40223.1 23S rRNA (cytidine1920-2'-O)/16S rRNA (cytidine1409-2'-O)-methyltransferase [Melghirimyces algeriensis]